MTEKRTLKFNAFVLKVARQMVFLPSEKCPNLLVIGETFSNAALPVLSFPLEHSAKASSIPSGTVFLCLLVEGDVEIEFLQPLGQRLMLLFLLGMF